MRAIIYGSGVTGSQIYANLYNSGKAIWNESVFTATESQSESLQAVGKSTDDSNKLQVVAFSDSNPKVWGEKRYELPVISPSELHGFEYDKIIVGSIMGYESISKYLHEELGIPIEKIDISYVNTTAVARDKFLRSFAQIVYKNGLSGNVAEGGVNEGAFAAKINAAFPDRTLYLFDTFEGFDKRDTDFENVNGYSTMQAGHLSGYTSVDKVSSILPNPEKAVIRKGYFPETADGIDDMFVFVNLDFDLHNPTFAGLEFFWPKMVRGGVILVHDYFNKDYSGVKAAVDEFGAKHKVAYMPIADEMSVALIKY